MTDIDAALKLDCGYPMGPFTLMDMGGLDTVYYASEILYEQFREPRFAAPPLLKRLVATGRYGRKTGKGFYDYTKP